MNRLSFQGCSSPLLCYWFSRWLESIETDVSIHPGLFAKRGWNSFSLFVVFFEFLSQSYSIVDVEKKGGYATATLSDMLALYGDEGKWQQPPILFSWWFSTCCFLVDVSSSATVGSELTTPLHELIRVCCQHDSSWFAPCPKSRRRTRYRRINTSSSTQTKPCLYWRELGREIWCSNSFPTVLRQIKFVALANEKNYQKTFELGHWPLRWVENWVRLWQLCCLSMASKCIGTPGWQVPRILYPTLGFEWVYACPLQCQLVSYWYGTVSSENYGRSIHTDVLAAGYRSSWFTAFPI